MVGEIGGTDEEEAALWAKENMKKPIVGFIAGVTAPRVSAWDTPVQLSPAVAARRKVKSPSWKNAESKQPKTPLKSAHY